MTRTRDPMASVVALAIALSAGCTGLITGGNGDEPPVITPGVPCNDERAAARQLRLLTRREYQNTVRDLLGVEVDTASLPVEPRVRGFDNNAAAAVLTSRHMDSYLALAEDAVERALTTRRAQLVPCDAAAAGCPRQLVEQVGLRVMRRPLTEDEITSYTSAFTGRSFDDGVRVAVASMMISPSFLYRWEIGTLAGTIANLDSYEIASQLSYLFLGSMPDQALLDAARADKLRTPEARQAQARRLLGDPRARVQVAEFVGQWLRTDGITGTKDASIYPTFTDGIRTAMTEEERRFITHVVFELDGSFKDLFTANYVMVNNPLAEFYGLPGVNGDGFIKLPVSADTGRGGLLALGSVLASHAHSNESSPIKRGVFVRTRLLCQDLTPPPPDLDTTPPGLDPALTTRERFARHTSDAACSGCHQYIDSIGFGFEGFDGVGGRRTVENGRPIDMSGDVFGIEDPSAGTHSAFTDVPALGALLAESEAAQACLPRQYFRFARGIEGDEYDECAIHNLQLGFADADLSIQELLVSIVAQPSFTLRK